MKPKSASQLAETTDEFQPGSLFLKTSPFTLERVNEVTFKVTNGELTTVPASYGQWGGYRTTKALAWVINIGPNSWLARYRDHACGPSTFPQAKADALAMAKGATGDYFVSDPIAHLNGLAARLVDADPEDLRRPIPAGPLIGNSGSVTPAALQGDNCPLTYDASVIPSCRHVWIVDLRPHWQLLREGGPTQSNERRHASRRAPLGLKRLYRTIHGAHD